MEVVGSSPTWSTLNSSNSKIFNIEDYNIFIRRMKGRIGTGSIAQSVERTAVNRQVAGSSPAGTEINQSSSKKYIIPDFFLENTEIDDY